MVKIGPTGKFPSGKPYFEEDVGGINSAFRVEPPNCRWDFGITLNEIVLQPDKARIVIDTFRKDIKAAYPNVKAGSLPRWNIFVHAAVDMTVRIDFLRPIPRLIAKPEVFLAIADSVERELAKIKRWN